MLRGAPADATPTMEFVRNACRDGQLADLQRAVNRDNLRDFNDAYHYTPLHWAARAGQVETVQFLLGLGAEVDAVTQTGYTPLLFSAWSAHPPVVKALLDAGAKVDVRDNSGCTALQRCSSAVCVRLLVQAGADVNTMDKARSTPLLRSLQACSKVRALHAGHAPSDVARQEGLVSMALLLDAGADTRLLPPDYKAPRALCVYVARRAAVALLVLRRFRLCAAMRHQDVHIIAQIAKLVWNTRADTNIWVRRINTI